MVYFPRLGKLFDFGQYAESISIPQFPGNFQWVGTTTVPNS